MLNVPYREGKEIHWNTENYWNTTYKGQSLTLKRPFCKKRSIWDHIEEKLYSKTDEHRGWKSHMARKTSKPKKNIEHRSKTVLELIKFSKKIPAIFDISKSSSAHPVANDVLNQKLTWNSRIIELPKLQLLNLHVLTKDFWNLQIKNFFFI